jgi:DNA-binding CsgD family transcriptional regulator/tetratricopeptide (TPR) repeat protein
VLPAALRLAPSFPFVGRAQELRTLTALIPRGADEPCRLALVGGEAGSGKSRLIRELAQRAAAEGSLVLYGGCDAAVQTPYRPFSEAIGQLVRNLGQAELEGAVGAAGGELRRLVPEVGARIPGLPAPMAGDPDTERHRLHTAVADVLAGAGRLQPVMLVIEDGHWADAPTLHLLRHLARSPVAGALLIVATFRDTEADVPADLADTLADLRRGDDVVRLRLAGLSVDEVAAFVRGAAGVRQGPRALAVAIHNVTQGNVFLVSELWRMLLETGAVTVDGHVLHVRRPLDDLAAPESVREVVSRRVAGVAAVTRDLLEVAAVAGAAFDLAVVQPAAGQAAGEVRAGLEEALAHGMLEEVPGRPLAFQFTHELVRRALYDRMSGLRRAELHLRIAMALEDRPHVAPADLAYHYGAAVPLASPDRAIRYHLLAAAAATAAVAHDDAASHLRTALELGIDDPAEQAEAQLALGDAYYRAGQSAPCLEAFRAAADMGRERGDGELLARAAIGYEKACWRPALTEAGARELLEEAVAALPEDDSELRARVLGGLARASDAVGDAARSEIAHTEALAIARRLGDRAVLASITMSGYWSRGLGRPLRLIVDELAEAVQLATELGDDELRAEAGEWRISALMGLGEMDQARRELMQVRALAEQVRQPFILHVAEHYRSAIALADGRLDEADEAAQRSRDWSDFLTGRDASGVYGIQMFNVRREQGALAGLAPIVRVLAGQQDSLWQPGLAALLAELGMEDEARRAVEPIVADGLARYRESLWLGSLIYLADAATFLRLPELAAPLYEALVPESGSNLMVGHGVAVFGAADRYLGMLAAVLGWPAVAERHFTAGLEQNRRMGAHTWVAHTLAEHGLALRVPELLEEAARLAGELRLPRVLNRLATARPGRRPAELPDGLSPREVTILRLVADGRSNRDIGAALVISEHTAANHVRSILRKTGCANRTEAAAYAHRRGLVDPAPAR